MMRLLKTGKVRLYPSILLQVTIYLMDDLIYLYWINKYEICFFHCCFIQIEAIVSSSTNSAHDHVLNNSSSSSYTAERESAGNREIYINIIFNIILVIRNVLI